MPRSSACGYMRCTVRSVAPQSKFAASAPPLDFGGASDSAIVPGGDSVLAIGIRIAAESPTGVRLGSLAGGTGAGFTSYVTLLDVPDTGSGGIESEIPIQITRRERDRLVGQIGDGRGRIVIDGGSGRVRLKKS